MSMWLLWLWTRLDEIGLVASIATLLSALALVFLIPFAHIEESAFWWRSVKNVLRICAVATLIYLAVPSKKDAAIIYLVPKIVESKSVQELVDTMQLLPKALRKHLEEFLGVAPATKERAL